MAADGPSAPRLPTTTRACFASHDRLEEGVTGPSQARRASVRSRGSPNFLQLGDS